jgi:phosphoglycerate dehydrogenase-like enzyme
MRVWGSNRSGREVEGIDMVVAGEEWRQLLPEADFVVVTLPLTNETRSMIGAAELRQCKPGAWLINVGRGATIDEAAMFEALRAGHLGGIAIDAWVEEPLPPDHPAWTTPNVIIWPHHSGSSPRNNERNLDLFIENLQRFIKGEELRNIVDYEAGY